MPVFMDTNPFRIALAVNRREDKQAQAQSAMVIPLRIDTAMVHAMIAFPVGNKKSQTNQRLCQSPGTLQDDKQRFFHLFTFSFFNRN